MKKRKTMQFRIFYAVAAALFICFSAGPILWSFVMSVTPQPEILADSARLWPEHPTFANYAKLIGGSGGQGLLFKTGLLNSLKAVFFALLIGLPLTVLCAYPLARFTFKCSSAFRNTLLFTLAIPVFATIIPLYKLFSGLGLLDNSAALALVYVTSFLPLTVWLLIGAFESLPLELEEAAAIDGCSRFKTLLLIVLPVASPAVLAAALTICLAVWNQFQIPLILAPSRATKPIAVVISEFVTRNTVDYGLMNAGGILALIPPALTALIFRKFLINGMAGEINKG